MGQTMWLNCFASVGQFSNEYAVWGSDFAGKDFSLFAPNQRVRCDEPPTRDKDVPAQLEVTVLEAREGLALVRLPAQTFENGSTITVREDQPARSAAAQVA
jgi:hypothetical protein